MAKAMREEALETKRWKEEAQKLEANRIAE